MSLQLVRLEGALPDGFDLLRAGSPAADRFSEAIAFEPVTGRPWSPGLRSG